MRYPPIVPGYPHVLHGGDYNPDQWLDRPEVIDEDFRMMPLAGCNAFSVGIFSWSLYEPEEGVYDFSWLAAILDRMAAAGNKVFLATPSGAKPAWMARRYPEIRRVVDKFGHRSPQEMRHNHCWSSPVYREKVRQINSELATRFAHHPAVGGWHISNELHGECFCPLCLAWFRKFLRERYGSLEALNRAWYARFWNVWMTTWDDVTPFVSGDAPRLDWMRFVSEQCRDWIAWEKAPLKAANPDLPVTTNFMGFFDGLDYWRLAPELDFVSDDVYPEWDSNPDLAAVAAYNCMRADMQRACKGGRPPLIMESCPSATNWQKYARLKRPGVHRFQEVMALAHGCDGTLYFQWRKARGSSEKTHGSVIDHVGHEHTRVFRDVAALGDLYRKLDDLTGAPVANVDTAFVFDWEALWAYNFTAGPSCGAVKRPDAINRHYQSLWRLNLGIDVIEQRSDFSPYKLLVAPRLFLLQPGTAARMRRFVEGGGTLVLTYLSGYVDVNDQFFLGELPGDGLAELCGVWNEEVDGLADYDKQVIKWDGREWEVRDYAEIIHPKEGTEVLGVYGAQFYAGSPALTRRRVGKGQVYYLAARAGGDFLDAFYAYVAAGAGVAHALPRADAGVHAMRRTSENGDFLFLFNCDPGRELTAELPAGDFVDVDTGETRRGPVALPPFASWVLRRAESK